MANDLSDTMYGTIDSGERLSRLRQDINSINTLVFPLQFQDRYKALTHDGLIGKIQKYLNPDNVSIECDLVTIGWLVIAFYVGQEKRYADNEGIIKKLYHASHLDDVFVDEDLKLLHMALEIGTRIINGEGETDSFEEFDSEQYITLCWDFDEVRQSELLYQRDRNAYFGVQYLIQNLKYLKKDPRYTDRTPFSDWHPYKESTILAQLTPTSYSATRTIFNRAINAVDPLWGMRDPEKEYKTKVKIFKEALYRLKSEILTAYRSKTCDVESAMMLANLALGLAQKIEQKSITQSDIDSFITATNKYRTTATMNATLNQLIYAGVAIIALICTATAIIAGAGVIGAVLATTAGLGVGIGVARYTIWQKNKIMLTKVDHLAETALPCISNVTYR